MSSDIVTAMNSFLQMVQNKIKADAQRFTDPNWQLVSTHVMSQELLNLAQSPDTPPNIKHLIYISSFVGNQWVYIGEEKSPAKSPLIAIDTPITDWGLNADES